MKLPALLILLFTLMALPPVQAQPANDAMLAEYYYNNGEFDKALLYYEKLYATNPTDNIYQAYLQVLLQLKQYKEAGKLVKQHKKMMSGQQYHLDLGRIAEATGDVNEAEKEYQNAIDALPENQSAVSQLAETFIELNKLELARQTYERGRQMLGGRYQFNYELAALYGSMGDKQRMISEYLNLIEVNSAYAQTVQNALNRTLNFEDPDNDDVEILRTELLKRVQANQAQTIYSEMLIWLYVQQQNFEGAFIQLRALDKRLKEDGSRILNLAALCVNNKAYATAEKCYNYLIDKGPESPYYIYAKKELLSTRFTEIRDEFAAPQEELKRLKTDYQNAIAELGPIESVSMSRELAKLEAWYLHELDSAAVRLEGLLNLPIRKKEIEAEVKLELADILLARGDIWDASLLYSQVDKDFKYDQLGFQAKFMNARISYYTGDFRWAQAQLDVLKGSTSKLISNNAMELSLLITDNMGLDTTLRPMMLFANADLLIVQRRFGDALQTLDSLNSEFPGHALSDEILFRRAEIAERQKDYEKAAGYYREVIRDYYTDIMADNALYQLANLYRTHLNDPAQAQELYKQLMIDFPGSLFVVDARKYFRELRGDKPGDMQSPAIIPNP